MSDKDLDRRRVMMAAAAAGIAMTGGALAQTRTDTSPAELDGKPVPEPGPERTAGPVVPGRGTILTGMVAIVGSIVTPLLAEPSKPDGSAGETRTK